MKLVECDLISSQSRNNFKYLARNSKKDIVLVPGWATDQRIFKSLDLKFNYILTPNLSVYDFEKKLLHFIEENKISKIALFGWSLGGFLAADFSAKYPSLVSELVLVSVRRRYNEKEIGEIKGFLTRNKKGYLYKFYNQCFENKVKMNWFRENLLKKYCQELSLEGLLEGLDYLKDACMDADRLKNIEKIKIIHGEFDSIAPIKEAIEVKNTLANATFMQVDGAGHIPFLEQDIGKYI